MAVSAALATVVALPLAVGAGVVLGVAVADPVTRPAATVDYPRPVAAVPGPYVSLPLPPPGSSPPSRGSSPPAATGSPSPPVPPAGQGGFAWPLAPRPAVLRPFRLGPFPWSPGHRGVDLLARPAQPVLAAAEGRVSFAGPLAGRPVVVVVHAGGIRTTYEPVDPLVRAGDAVPAGGMLGTLAVTVRHCVSPCLHWGALEGGAYLDPATLLPGHGPVILLPLSGLPRD